MIRPRPAFRTILYCIWTVVPVLQEISLDFSVKSWKKIGVLHDSILDLWKSTAVLLSQSSISLFHKSTPIWNTTDTLIWRWGCFGTFPDKLTEAQSWEEYLSFESTRILCFEYFSHDIFQDISDNLPQYEHLTSKSFSNIHNFCPNCQHFFPNYSQSPSKSAQWWVKLILLISMTAVSPSRLKCKHQYIIYCVIPKLKNWNWIQWFPNTEEIPFLFLPTDHQNPEKICSSKFHQ